MIDYRLEPLHLNAPVLPQPLYAGVFVGGIWLNRAHVDLARDGLVDGAVYYSSMQFNAPLPCTDGL